MLEAEEVLSCVKACKDYLTEQLLDELRTEVGSHSPPRVQTLEYATEVVMFATLFVAEAA